MLKARRTVSPIRSSWKITDLSRRLQALAGFSTDYCCGRTAQCHLVTEGMQVSNAAVCEPAMVFCDELMFWVLQPVLMLTLYAPHEHCCRGSA